MKATISTNHQTTKEREELNSLFQSVIVSKEVKDAKEREIRTKYLKSALGNKVFVVKGKRA